MNEGPLFMLAADHRWQWTDWCHANGVDVARIPETKRLALDGLLAARTVSGEARRAAAFLVDQQYGASEVERARVNGVTVGTPVERPGVFPLEWSADPFWKAAIGDLVKVLVRHRPEWDADVRREQLAKLKTLGEWCAANGRTFLLEVVVMPGPDEREEEFEASGRPAIVSDFIGDAYAAGVVPDYWKIEGTTVGRAMQMVDAAVAQRSGPRMVILGKAAGFDVIDAWFIAASRARTATGFAIGRSVYWTPAAQHLAGTIDGPTAIARIAENYLRVIESWNNAQAMRTA